MATSGILRPLAVIAGVGNATGTGAATARLLSKHGYSVALIARGAGSLRDLADEIKDTGGEAEPFPIPEYSPEAISDAFSAIRNKFPSPSAGVNGRPLRVAIFNAAQGVFKPFLDVTPQDVRETLEVNVTTAFTFARESILDFKKNDIADGKRGTIIFTGATAALRGNVMTSVFAAGKHGQRALSQSLAKEFGKDNIHVAHTIIDGQILTDRTRSYNDGASNWETNADARLSPESIASAYLYLVNQDRSAWTWELDHKCRFASFTLRCDNHLQYARRTRNGEIYVLMCSPFCAPMHSYEDRKQQSTSTARYLQHVQSVMLFGSNTTPRPRVDH